MKEIEFIDTITKTLTDSSLLGDDCAFLAQEITGNSGLFVTQDSLVEDVHFSLAYTDASSLGKKAVNVNLSDLAATCAKPLVLMISLSLPADIEGDFVVNFYKGVNEICEKYGIKVAGGDITGSEKVYISICAIGKKVFPYNISRKNATPGDIIATTGCHGNSAGGLKLLCQKKKEPYSLVNAHLCPEPCIEKSIILSQTVKKNFAMMDSSDGLADALFKIAQASKVDIEAYTDKIPVSNDLIETFPDEYRELCLWGGEDYELVFSLSPDEFEKLDKSLFFQIGRVLEHSDNPVVKIISEDRNFVIDDNVFNTMSFNHFKGDTK